MGRERGTSFSFGNSKPKEEPIDVYHIGLLNLGNSCFYNTILQSLSVTRPLSNVIHNPPSTSPALAMIAPSSPTYNPDPDSLLSPLPLSQALVTILAKLDPVEKKAFPKTFNPKGLLRELSRKHEEYAAATQQDAHEVLRHLIDGIMMEEVDYIKKVLQLPEKEKPKRPAQSKRRLTIRGSASPLVNGSALPPIIQNPIVEEPENAGAEADDDADDDDDDDDEDDDDEEVALATGEAGLMHEEKSDLDSSSSSSDTSDEEASEEKIQARELARKRRKTTMRPFIDTVFGGKLASVVICDECKNVSLTREDFMDLSLSLKDDDGKLRKRDRIRKTLQAGFFSKKSSTESSSSASTSTSGKNGQTPARMPLARRETTSLSETDATTSASGSDFESESNDDEHDAARMNRLRRKSLEPGLLAQHRRPAWSGSATETSRDGSPLGRALSIVSSSGHSSRRKPKIPKPTKEQLAYIRKVLAEVPGPAPSPLPTQLRWANPGGPRSATDASAATQSLSQLKLQGSTPVDTSTDLYACLQQFTAVETLDNDNSFACRNCWKLLNPDLVERRRQEKEQRRVARLAKSAGNDPADGALVPPGMSPTSSYNDGATQDSDTPAGSIVSPVSSRPIPLPSVPSILATSPEEESTPRMLSPLSPTKELDFSSASASKDSLLSSLSGQSRSDDADSVAQLADVEDVDLEDSGNVSETSFDVSPAVTDVAPGVTAAPLTESNVKALAPASGTNLSVASADKGGAAVTRAVSGASLSTRVSAVSSSSNVKPTPPRQERHILRRAHKRYLISALDLPPVLVIHFKRFMQTSKASLFGSAFTNLKKRDDDLTFPQELDLTPFLTPPERPPRSPLHLQRPRPHRESTLRASPHVPSARYRLYAVVVHIGTLVGGHYVNYVLSDRYAAPTPKRSASISSISENGTDDAKTPPPASPATPPRRWFFCSDDEVRPCSADEVLRSKAYMLLYERVEDPVNVPIATRSRM